MSTLGYILLFTFLGSVVSLIGGFLLLTKNKIVEKSSHFLASFAAGVLLATAFLDLLPEAADGIEELGEINIFLWTLFGFLAFFLLERFIHWFHHHHEHAKDKAIVSLVTIGDSLHNFIDGVVIAATFLVDINLGIITSLAVAAHEIPQEIGDFGLLLNKGVKKSKVIILNVMSALTAMLGAILTYIAADSIESKLPIFLALSAGFFIYIAASDLIPEIHNQDKRKIAVIETLVLFLGVLVVWILVSFLEGLH